MDRIIEVKVDGNYIRKDKKTAGIRGEYEVAILRIEFDESWDEYKKTITFWDARGLNSVFRELDPTKLENHAQSERVFLVPIPAAPMAVAGDMTFVIDGIVEGKKQRSVSDKLEVKDAPMSEDAKPPVEPTPNDVEQMRLELGKINDSILKAVEAKEDILNMTVHSETLETGEAAFVIKTEHDGVSHLHFGLPKGDTGDSGVYIGDEAPSEPVKNVWINPSASKLILMIRNEQGEWVEIPAITGKSAYEIALKYGFVGTEAEWNDAVNLNRIAAENAFTEADKARIAAENAKSSAEVYSGQTYQYYLQADESADKANNAATSAQAHEEDAIRAAADAKEQSNIATQQALIAQHNAMDSGENVTFARDFAEQAKASADKAEQYANEFSGDIQRIEAGLSLRPTTEQVKAMHEEDLVENYNIRKIPEGKTIDDLYLEEDYGLYMIDDECPFAELEFTSRGSQLIVTGGYYWLEGFGDKSTTCQVLLCHDGIKYVIKQRSLQNGKWSVWEDQFATKYDVEKLTYLKDFLKDRPQGLYVDDLDNLTYENTGGGVFLWGRPQDGAKQNDIVFVTQGLSPMRDELTTFQMKISLATAYPEPNGYNIKQRYRKHNSQGDFDGWSEWEEIYATKDYVDSVNTKINEIIDSAPEALNTLKELADALNNEPDFAATVADSLANKVDKEEGKGLSTEDFTTSNKKQLSYLANFFKPIPEGKTIDDLNGEDNTGCYILYGPNYLGYTGLLYVVWGTYFDGVMGNLGAWQTRYMQDGKGTVKIEKRWNDGDKWTEWEEIYTTKDYVDSENQKLKNEIEESIEKYNIVSTSSGENINVTDGSKSSFRGMRIYGKTTQNGTPLHFSAKSLDSVGGEGSLSVNVGKKNIINFSKDANEEASGFNFAFEKGGSSIVINGTATMIQHLVIHLENNVLLPGTYTASVIGLNSNYEKYDTLKIIKSRGSDDIVEGIMSNSPKTFTIEESTEIKLYITIQYGSSYDRQTVYFQIEPGEVETEYAPYEQPKTLVVDTPNGLPGIKLDSASLGKNLATYTDANGDKWISDVIDFEKGVYIQNIKRTLVNITQYATLSNGLPCGVFHCLDKLKMPQVAALCEKSTFRPSGSLLPLAEGYFYENLSNFVFIGTETDTLESLKSKYDGCEMMYVLNKPVEIPLSNEQIAAYKETISMYNPTTRYYNSENAGMEIDYVSDTKKYIDSKIDELETNGNPASIIVDQEYNPESENAQSGIAVAQAISQMPTGGGGATFFESETPQIDITLDEDTTSLDITTIGGKLLSEFNYTTAKILIENAVLPEKGANGGLNLYINSDYGSRYRVSLPGFPTTFLTNNTKQYWSGYCNFAEGIIFGLASATGNAAWGANMQTLADSSPLHEYKKVERVYLLSATTTVPMPIGTKIKIWFK